MSTARKPDFIVKAILRDDTRTRRLGAAWVNDREPRVTIKLDPCVNLAATDVAVIGLFSREDGE